MGKYIRYINEDWVLAVEGHSRVEVFVYYEEKTDRGSRFFVRLPWEKRPELLTKEKMNRQPDLEAVVKVAKSL